MKTLNLTLKKKWFDMIASGIKKEEYREIKPYWVNRLVKHCTANFDWFPLPNGTFKDIQTVHEYAEYDYIIFKNGYSEDSPEMMVKCKGIKVGEAKPEWSDNWQGQVFIIKLGNIVYLTDPQITNNSIL